MSKPIIPVLHMWEKYKEDVKNLIDNPFATAVKALQQADEADDWEGVRKATELLSFLVNEVSSQ